MIGHDSTPRSRANFGELSLSGFAGSCVLALVDQRHAPQDQDSDSAWLEALWREHRAWIAAIVQAIRPGASEAEDLLQEVALKVVQGSAQLRDANAVRPWLRSIAKNVCTDAGRRQQVRRCESVDLAELSLADTTGAKRVEDEDELEQVRVALATLPESSRELLALRAVDGLSYRQIAETLEVPETTIEQRLVRARKALRSALDKSRANRIHSRDIQTWSPL